MANIIFINDLRANQDPGFIKTPIGYVADDSTSRPILGMGDMLELDKPPLTAGDFGNIRASIEGTDEFNYEKDHDSIYNHYSDIDKGQVQYYIDTNFVNPFQPFFKDNNHLSFKQIMPDRTIEYTRQPIVPIQRDTSLNPLYDERLLKLENPSLYGGSPMGKGGLNFTSAEARMGPNNLYNPNQWFVDSQNQREDIQALQMRTIIRHNYAPAQLF
jgi:hypothetical protein